MAVAAQSLKRQAAALAKAEHVAAGGAAAATEEEEPTVKTPAGGAPDPANVRVGPAPYEAAETTRLGDESVGDRVEVSARSLVTMQEVALRVAQHGGGALIVDYGHDHASADSLRGIRRHRFTHPLEAPGKSDLVRRGRSSGGGSVWLTRQSLRAQTADVDFCALRKAGLQAGEGAVTVRVPPKPLLRPFLQKRPLTIVCEAWRGQAWGPITQSEFLHNMGIGPRMAQLLQANDGGGRSVRLLRSRRR